MKKVYLLLLPLIFSTLIFEIIQSGEVKYLENIIERKDQQSFQNAIAKGNIVIDFYADWCGPCKKLNPILIQIVREIDNITFIKVNIDKFPALRTYYNIKSIPTLLYFKDGKVINRSTGLLSKKKLAALLKVYY